MCSNSEGALPVRKARIRMKGNGNTDVNQQNFVKSYNSGMGEEDLADQAMSELRPKIEGEGIGVCQ